MVVLGENFLSFPLFRGTRDMLIAHEGEEIVCAKGTVCGRMTRDANDQIIDGDFAARILLFARRPALPLRLLRPTDGGA